MSGTFRSRGGAPGRVLALLLFLGTGLAAQDSVVVFLRHAEKAHRGPAAELSARGRRRAEALPGSLAVFAPAALFASELVRTQQTLAPLAGQLALPIQIYERGAEWDLGKELLRRYAGRTVVVCGHSDRLMELVRALGHSEPFPEIGDFDHFWILRVPEGGGSPTLETQRQRPLAP